MLSNKRKLGDYGLGRRVKARKEEESDVEVESSDAPSEEEVNASEGSEEEQDDEDGSENDDDTEVRSTLQHIYLVIPTNWRRVETNKSKGIRH